MAKGKKKSPRISPLASPSNPPHSSSSSPPPLLPLPPPLLPPPPIPPVGSILADSPPTIPVSGKLVQGLGSTIPQLQPDSSLSTSESTHSEPKKLEESSSAGNHVLQPLEKEISKPVETKNTQSKPSWADCVKGQSGRMRKKGNSFVLDSGELCVKIPNEVITKNAKRWDHFILGQFHGKTPSPGALHAIFNGIWSNKHRDITASKLGERTILIRIPNGETRKRVLNQGIWHIEGQTMFVARWEPGLTPTMPELTEIPVWLEFRGVPPHFFSIEGFEHIAGLLGEPLHCHPSTVNMTNMEVGKVFTVINPLKPLPEAVNLQFASGEIHRIGVSSPWLPPLCSHCSEIGHSLRRCPTAPITCTACESTSHGQESCPKTAYRSRTSSKRGRSIRVVDRPREMMESAEMRETTSSPSRGDHHIGMQPVQPTQPMSLPIKVIDHISETDLPVSTTALASPPLRTYLRSKKGNKLAKKMNLTKEIESDEKKDDKSDTTVTPASTDYTSDDVSDTSDESITPFTRVTSKKDRRIERNYQGTRPKSNRRV